MMIARVLLILFLLLFAVSPSLCQSYIIPTDDSHYQIVFTRNETNLQISQISSNFIQLQDINNYYSTIIIVINEFENKQKAEYFVNIIVKNDASYIVYAINDTQIVYNIGEYQKEANTYRPLVTILKATSNFVVQIIIYCNYQLSTDDFHNILALSNALFSNIKINKTE